MVRFGTGELLVRLTIFTVASEDRFRFLGLRLGSLQLLHFRGAFCEVFFDTRQMRQLDV